MERKSPAKDFRTKSAAQKAQAPKVRKLSFSAVSAAVAHVYQDAIWDTKHLRRPVEEALLAGLNVIKGGSMARTFDYERKFEGDIYDDRRHIEKDPYSITTTTGDKIQTLAEIVSGGGPSRWQPDRWNESIRFEPETGRNMKFANPRDTDIIAVLEKVAIHAHEQGQIVLEQPPKKARRPSGPAR